MDKKPLARAQSREVRITFRATETEDAELKQDAASEDIPISWLIRRRLRMARTMEQSMGMRKAAGA